MTSAKDAKAMASSPKDGKLPTIKEHETIEIKALTKVMCHAIAGGYPHVPISKDALVKSDAIIVKLIDGKQISLYYDLSQASRTNLASQESGPIPPMKVGDLATIYRGDTKDSSLLLITAAKITDEVPIVSYDVVKLVKGASIVPLSKGSSVDKLMKGTSVVPLAADGESVDYHYVVTDHVTEKWSKQVLLGKRIFYGCWMK